MIRKESAEESGLLVWFKSSYSDTSNGNDCVEVAAASGMVHVRDSKNGPGPQVDFGSTAWADFLAHTADG
ncbi:DUF397 domain-containing protein [Streptomyces sp. NBC_01754]|uniref:DUF397 domain-containing protein n=1 Tax=Streptomyces sp. NBC_01754 TaxID=2975930 RepID=UPI002DDABC2E|nr:DUF397 domain-containing protein [Streptomyces sp. NBC_01754]WSC92825.1 DUF397 domain-containing protein [Streptomyces sp. NBC_01754]